MIATDGGVNMMKRKFIKSLLGVWILLSTGPTTLYAATVDEVAL
jgi:hypothetical protein